MDQVRALFRILWSQKLRILAALILIPLFIVVLFPVDDVSDLVTREVAKATHNQVYVTFEHMDLSFLPSPGVAFEQFSLETGPLPPLSIRKLELNPSLMGLLLQKIDASATAEGLFRGNVKVSIKPGKKLENGVTADNIQLQADNLNLNDLRQFAGLPIAIKGQISAKADGQIDMTFASQPDVTIDLTSPQFELSPSTVETMMGPLTLPELKLGKLLVKGRLSGGKFEIFDGVIGKEGDDLVGTIKGTMALEMRNMGGRVMPLATNYEFQVDLTAKKNFEERSKMFLMLIESHRQAEGENGRYRFRISGNAQTQQFSFSPLR